MLLRSLNKEDEKENIKKPINKDLILYKLLFLIVAVALGVVFMSRYAEIQPAIEQAEKRAESVKAMPVGDMIAQDVKATSREVVRSVKEEAGIGDTDILGATSKLVEYSASKSAEVASDYIYANTVEELIKKLIGVLPERRKEVIIEWVNE